MPLIEGGTLQQYAAVKPLPVEQTLSTAIQIASALSALHAAGIVHRDLKPSNILLQDDLEHVLISDFGLARIAGDMAITHSEALAGTPFFMSPEQALGKQVDIRSDLFSFGCVLFWMCSGKYPFRGDSNYETLSRLIHNEPEYGELVQRSVPVYLQLLIRRLLAKDPAARWSSADQVAGLLRASLAHFHSSELPLPLELAQSDSDGVTAQRPEKARSLSARGIVAAALSLVLVLAVAFTAVSNRFGSNRTETGDTLQATETVLAPAPTANLRYGAFDELDRRALFSDLERAENLPYWLRRMAYLPVDQIPVEALPAVQALSENSDATIRELAAVILNKNPFQEIHVLENSPKDSQISTQESPFQEVFTDE